MPTLCGFRRRGYSPEAIRKFIDMIGYTKFDALNDFAMLEAAVREDLNARQPVSRPYLTRKTRDYQLSGRTSGRA